MRRRGCLFAVLGSLLLSLLVVGGTCVLLLLPGILASNAAGRVSPGMTLDQAKGVLTTARGFRGYVECGHNVRRPQKDHVFIFRAPVIVGQETELVWLVTSRRGDDEVVERVTLVDSILPCPEEIQRALR